MCEFQLWGINGFAQGIVFPALMLLLSGYLDKRTRGTVLGLWTTSQQLGGVVATAFVGFVLQHAGWRAAYVGTAVHSTPHPIPVIVVLVVAPLSSYVVPALPTLACAVALLLLLPSESSGHYTPMSAQAAHKEKGDGAWAVLYLVCLASTSQRDSRIRSSARTCESR